MIPIFTNKQSVWYRIKASKTHDQYCSSKIVKVFMNAFSNFKNYATLFNI